MEKLKDTILEAARKVSAKPRITYGEKIEELIDYVVKLLEKDENLSRKYPLRWLAIKLLENDEDALTKIKNSKHRREILEVIT